MYKKIIVKLCVTIIGIRELQYNIVLLIVYRIL